MLNSKLIKWEFVQHTKPPKTRENQKKFKISQA